MFLDFFFSQEMHFTKDSYLRVQVKVELLYRGEEDEDKGLQTPPAQISFSIPQNSLKLMNFNFYHPL